MPRRLLLLCASITLSGWGCDEDPAGGDRVPCTSADDCGAEARCGDDGFCASVCIGGAPLCGDVCCDPATEACVDGVCEATCAGTPCGDACCGEDQVCQGGACVAGCPTALCAGACCGEGEGCYQGQICCAPEDECGASCCGDGELCDEGLCKTDCGGGVPGCGPSEACCAEAEICYQGQCLVPGDACTPTEVCATRPEQRDCPDGQTCDPNLLVCVPEIVDESCTFVPPVGVFEPRPLFTWGQRRARACQTADDCQTAETCPDGTCQVTWPHVTPTTMPEHYQSSSIPMVADLDGDCVPEIVLNTYAQSNFTGNGVLRAIRGDDGAEVWTVEDEAYRTDGSANPAVGDVDGDGTPEVFVTGPGRNILRIDGDGTPRWISDAFAGPEGSASIAIANLDGAGDAELVVGAAVFDSAGTLLAEGNAGAGYAGQGPISCLADLDGDTRPELIAGNTVYETTGTVAGGDFAMAVRREATVNDGYCGVADMDGAAGPEVVLVSGGTVYVLQGQTLDVLASASIPGGGQGGAPNIADFDGDSRPDVGTAGARNYVVFRFRAPDQLELIWQAPTEDDSSSRTGSSVFDFDGDGRAEVVYNDEEFLRIYPGVEPACLQNPPGAACDGVMNDDEILFRDLNSSRTRTEYPVIADVDGDFKAEIVFATSNEANFLDPDLTGDAGIEVWADRLDNWVATRPVWNQHSYHITNSGPRGQIPAVEPDSWQTPSDRPYNSYRRNAQGDRETFCAPDLVIRDLVQDRSACPTLSVSMTLGNQGCLGVGPGVQVVLRDADGNVVASAMTSAALGPGSATVLAFDVNLGDAFTLDVTATIDDDGRFNECVEDNNATAPVQVECRIDL